jgi:hypothetical protein
MLDPEEEDFDRFHCTLNYISVIQWTLSNPTHQGTMEMCRIVQDVGKTQVFF